MQLLMLKITEQKGYNLVLTASEDVCCLHTYGPNFIFSREEQTRKIGNFRQVRPLQKKVQESKKIKQYNIINISLGNFSHFITIHND